MKIDVTLAGVSGSKRHEVEIEREGTATRIVVDGKSWAADAVQVTPNVVSVLLEGRSYEIHVTPSAAGKLKLQSGPHEMTAELQDPRAWKGRKHSVAEVEGTQQVLAPMPGKVVRLLVNAGDAVEAGQGLIVVEAMKMQNEIRSPKSGKVERLLAKEGQNVNAGDVLAWVE
jgi:biotin carboxyl carrier protein